MSAGDPSSCIFMSIFESDFSSRVENTHLAAPHDERDSLQEWSNVLQIQGMKRGLLLVEKLCEVHETVELQIDVVLAVRARRVATTSERSDRRHTLSIKEHVNAEAGSELVLLEPNVKVPCTGSAAGWHWLRLRDEETMSIQCIDFLHDGLLDLLGGALLQAVELGVRVKKIIGALHFGRLPIRRLSVPEGSEVYRHGEYVRIVHEAELKCSPESTLTVAPSAMVNVPLGCGPGMTHKSGCKACHRDNRRSTFVWCKKKLASNASAYAAR